MRHCTIFFQENGIPDMVIHFKSHTVLKHFLELLSGISVNNTNKISIVFPGSC